MRLLPAHDTIGWYPYAALSFLGFLLIEPLFAPVSAGELAVTLLGTGIFLIAYFWSFWLRSDRAQLLPMAVFCLVGVALSSINSGANVFFFYAAYLAGWMGRPRDTLLSIVVLLALVVCCHVLFARYPVYLLSGVIVTVALGAAGYQGRTMRDMNHALAESRQQMAQLARVAERERIARDLHDSLGRELTAVSLKADLAKRLLRDVPARAESELEDIARIARTALGDVRRQLAGRVALSLSTELPRAQALLGEAGVEVALREEGDRQPLSEDHETAVCYVLREAVTNIVRHAQARTACISLSWPSGAENREGLTLAVTDDGVGLGRSQGEGAEPGGMGLGGMRARIGALGGRFELSGDAGTKVLARVPTGL